MRSVDARERFGSLASDIHEFTEHSKFHRKKTGSIVVKSVLLKVLRNISRSTTLT